MGRKVNWLDQLEEGGEEFIDVDDATGSHGQDSDLVRVFNVWMRTPESLPGPQRQGQGDLLQAALPDKVR